MMRTNATTEQAARSPLLPSLFLTFVQRCVWNRQSLHDVAPLRIRLQQSLEQIFELCKLLDSRLSARDSQQRRLESSSVRRLLEESAVVAHHLVARLAALHRLDDALQRSRFAAVALARVDEGGIVGLAPLAEPFAQQLLQFRVLLRGQTAANRRRIRIIRVLVIPNLHEHAHGYTLRCG